MITDTYIGIGRGKLRDECVQPLKECRTLSCIGRRETGCQEGDAHRGIGHEEVVVYRLIAAGTQQWCHLLSQHIAHAQRVHLYQFRKHLSHFAQQVVVVFLHLLGEVFTCQ